MHATIWRNCEKIHDKETGVLSGSAAVAAIGLGSLQSEFSQVAAAATAEAKLSSCKQEREHRSSSSELLWWSRGLGAKESEIFFEPVAGGAITPLNGGEIKKIKSPEIAL
jgi:hypothetical protein